MEQRGRRWQQIPVFGEWNQLQCEELPMTQYFESAMQAGLVATRAAHHYYHDASAAGEAVVLFRSSSGSPPPHKPAKKVKRAHRGGASVPQPPVILPVRSATMDPSQQQQQVHAVSRRRQQVPLAVADGGPRAPRRHRVVRSVDEDLYQVHPDLLPKKGKGRRHVRSLWMGCVGLNCVA